MYRISTLLSGDSFESLRKHPRNIQFEMTLRKIRFIEKLICRKFRLLEKYHHSNGFMGMYSNISDLGQSESGTQPGSQSVSKLEELV